MTTANALAILTFMYGMLLAPKMMGAAAATRAGIKMRDMGGFFQFVGSLVAEILLSILYAPIMMVQQTIAVFRTIIGYRESWTPQQRLHLGAKGWSGRQMSTPEHLNAPHIIRTAMAERARFAAVLEAPEAGIAAE